MEKYVEQMVSSAYTHANKYKGSPCGFSKKQLKSEIKQAKGKLTFHANACNISDVIMLMRFAKETEKSIENEILDLLTKPHKEV